jgi:hypothetical protein
MTALVIFASGVAIGVVFDKAILKWKDKAVSAAKAMKSELEK